MKKKMKNGAGGRLFIVLIALLAYTSGASPGGFVGVTLGTAVSKMPRAERVVDFIRSMGVDYVRLYDADSSMVAALAGSKIAVAVGVPNNAIASMAASRAAAAAWLTRSVMPFLPNTNITTIVVGDAPSATVAPLVLPALHNIRRALLAVNRGNVSGDRGNGDDGAVTIQLTTAISSGQLLGVFPPSHAFFNETEGHLPPLLRFLSAAKSHLILNLDAHAAYVAGGGATPIQYALFQPNAGATDANTGLNYTNLFDAMLDAAFAATARIIRDRELPIVVQTGWPWRDPAENGLCSSKGSESCHVAATPANAKAFNTGVIKHVLKRRGTPMRPTAQISAYIYELYDEDLKSGGGASYGLFNVDQTPVYKIDVAGVTFAASSAADDGGDSSVPLHRWCVAKSGVSDDVLESALNWACGIGNADCGPVQPGGQCYLPNQVASHASFAFNSYYQRNIQGNGTCDFQGAAQLVTTDPSYESCNYPSSSSSLESPTVANSTTPSGAIDLIRIEAVPAAAFLVLLVLAL